MSAVAALFASLRERVAMLPMTARRAPSLGGVNTSLSEKLFF